jgi:lipopolysaccharide transport system ATP-binding protein
MSELAVRVEGLSKQYRLGGPRERYTTLRDQVNKLTSASLRALLGRGGRPERNGLFWALKDVSFEVKRGEVVGIIGRNGAGKSTLLKILSRITEPTEGEVDVHGRVGSLLEVGTGFHPELTGRENVYLNGAILGMKRGEIVRKFDEIVAFAEVEKFIDTPVKHYSSGMYMRLAFAVAAHLEPEILIVDEVLAVGDAAFQKKCLGKMGDVARGGRTVLFVSHNLSAVQSLCNRAVMLDRGKVRWIGPTVEVVGCYLAQHAPSLSYRRTVSTGGVSIEAADLELIASDNGLILHLTANVRSDRKTSVSLDLRLTDRIGVPIGFGSLGSLDPASLLPLEPGLNRVVGRFDGSWLAVGGYLVGLDLTYPDVSYLERVDNCLAFDINNPPQGTAIRRLNQHWGVGSCELHANLLAITRVQSPESPDYD